MVGDGISVGLESHQHLHPLSATQKNGSLSRTLIESRPTTYVLILMLSIILFGLYKKDCMRLMPHAIRVQLYQVLCGLLFVIQIQHSIWLGHRQFTGLLLYMQAEMTITWYTGSSGY